MLYIFLVVAGSVVSISFGMWHFFVPEKWNWYNYINDNAKELVLAVRATNIFFSLSLVLIGLMNILLVLNEQTSKYTLVVILSVNIVLWLTRVILQIIYPQGTMNIRLQYGMLSAFMIVLALFAASLVLVVLRSLAGI